MRLRDVQETPEGPEDPKRLDALSPQDPVDFLSDLSLVDNLFPRLFEWNNIKGK